MNEKAVYGQMCALAAFSPIHRKWSVEDCTRLFMPPIALRQFHMLEDGSAFTTWGWFSEEVRQAWMGPKRILRPDDWRSGQELWLVDVIAPFGNILRLARETQKRFPKGMRANGTRSYGTGRVQRVTEWINA